MKNTSWFIFKQIYLRVAMLAFCSILMIFSPLKAIIFSVSCHLVGVMFYSEYPSWLHSLKTYFEVKNKDLLESSPGWYYAGLIFSLFTGFFVFGLLELFNFTQTKIFTESSEDDQI